MTYGSWFPYVKRERRALFVVRELVLSGANSLRLENPKIPNASDCWRPAQDEVGDVLGQERAGNSRWDIHHEL